MVVVDLYMAQTSPQRTSRPARTGAGGSQPGTSRSRSTPHNSQLSLNGSRLVRFLAELAVSNIAHTRKGFAQRFGQLIDLSDSINLSNVHGELRRMKFEPLDITRDTIHQEFLRVRQSVVQNVIKSFAPHRGPSAVRVAFPNVSIDDDATFEPFQRFYLAHQREIDLRTQYIQSYVRDGVAGLSPTLAKLSALDSAVGDTLAAHTRKAFAVIPKLLAKRFEHLLEEHQQGALPLEEDQNQKPAPWLKTLRSDMQGLLLAELEVRLLPVLGLIEAIDENPTP